MKKTALKITGMHCAACAINIDFEVEDIEGVHHVITSHVKQTTEVTFDPKVTTIGKIVEAIAKLNYDAVEA